MTRCAEGCWELRDAPSNDRNASSDIVTSHRLLVVTLPKSTEGWTFQSPYDTIWWDTVFAGLSVSLSPCLPAFPQPAGLDANDRLADANDRL